MATIKEMTNEQLVGYCIWLDKEARKNKTVMNNYKAELQERGIDIMNNQNIKFVKFFGDAGSASIQDSLSLDVLNIDKLKELLGSGLYAQKVKETIDVKLKFDTKLERALKAIFTGDYTFEMTIDEFIDEMRKSYIITDNQKKLLLKKLKGEYDKDKETLNNTLDYDDPECDFDVELYYIYKIRNGELIKAFLPEEDLDNTINQIKKCILVETSTKITIDYDKSKEEEETAC